MPMYSCHDKNDKYMFGRIMKFEAMVYVHALQLSIYIYPHLHNNIYFWTLFSGNKHATENKKILSKKNCLNSNLNCKISFTFFSIQTTTIPIKTQKKCTSFSNRLNQSNFNNAILNDPCKKLNYTYGQMCGIRILFIKYYSKMYFK